MSKIDIKDIDPNYVCWDCGTPFLTEPQKKEVGAITAHTGGCFICGEMKTVTHIRHWNYLLTTNNK